MSFCPNCGSYVSPGTNICSCGTTFGYDSEPEKEEETEFQKQEKKRINTTDEYCRQGRKLMDNGDFLKAIEYFDKALEISPKYYPPTFNKAKAYYYAGLYEDALIWFNKTKFSGRCIDNYVILSWIRDTLNELNRFDEAIKAYKEAIDIINEDYDWTINFHKEQRWDSPSDSYLNSLLDERNERVSSIKYFLSIIFSN